MTARERFLTVMNFSSDDNLKKPDRLPMIEWAPWWTETYKRWQKEGLNAEYQDLAKFFGLESLEIISINPKSYGCPSPAYHGAPIIDPDNAEASYEAIRPYLMTDELIENAVDCAKQLKNSHDEGDLSIRIWLDGYFWFPRSLFGIEKHLYAFYDHPDLMQRMNAELTAFNKRGLEAVLTILKPDMIGFAEDMSYNHGPMLSYETFKEFLFPYYEEILSFIKPTGIKTMMDSDGDVMPLLPWLTELGIDGIYPLERQSGVDVAEIRKLYPKLLMMGAYDKMVMSKGEEAIRAEFERLLPVIKKGGFIPSVDHQTPPEVSLDNYKIYLKLLNEYVEKGVK